jgi:hypothetical protein
MFSDQRSVASKKETYDAGTLLVTHHFLPNYKTKELSALCREPDLLTGH